MQANNLSVTTVITGAEIFLDRANNLSLAGMAAGFGIFIGIANFIYTYYKDNKARKNQQIEYCVKILNSTLEMIAEELHKQDRGNMPGKIIANLAFIEGLENIEIISKNNLKKELSLFTLCANDCFEGNDNFDTLKDIYSVIIEKIYSSNENIFRKIFYNFYPQLIKKKQ